MSRALAYTWWITGDQTFSNIIFLWCFHMLCLAVRSGWILTLKKNQEANTSAREGSDCPRFCKAPNTLQNKPILVFQHTPFPDEQGEGGSHPHETHERSGTATCEDRAWPRKTVSITSWRNYFPWGKFHERSYSLVESQPCEYVSRIHHP